MIKVENINYSVVKKEILKDVSISFESGKIHAIAGPNGAGKSTLFKLLGQEIKANAGSIWFDQLEAISENRKKLSKCRALLSQQASLSFPLRVWEVVLMGRYPHYSTKPTATDEKIVEEALEAFSLGDFADRNFLTLSGGERQRVHFARSFAQVWQEGDLPRYLLLDEPLTFLDIRYQLSFFDYLRKFITPSTTVIAIIHDLNQVVQYCDIVHILNRGKLVASGEPQTIFQPDLIQNVFGFSGKIAQIEGRNVLLSN